MDLIVILIEGDLNCKVINEARVYCKATGSNLYDIVTYLSSLPQVHWVELQGQAVLLDKYATEILQDKENESETLIWDRGLKGNIKNRKKIKINIK